VSIDLVCGGRKVEATTKVLTAINNSHTGDGGKEEENDADAAASSFKLTGALLLAGGELVAWKRCAVTVADDQNI